jgi:DNA-directed RNA polymerase subunit RPC12/RpoP
MSTKRLSRRQFLQKVAVSAVALGVVGYASWGDDRGRTVSIRCSRCRARFNDGHRFNRGAVSGVYCPNCGVEITRLEFDVEQRTRFEYRAKAGGARKKPPPKWDCAQVPFPNRKRVARTRKPAVVLSDLNLRGGA